MMLKARGQASVEYLVITAFMLIVAAVIFVFALFSFSENANIAKAENSVTQIVNYANLVGSLGNGSRAYFTVDFPDNVKSVEIRNRAVNMVISSATGDSDVFSYSKLNLTPVALEASAGQKSLTAAFIDGNVVVAEVG